MNTFGSRDRPGADGNAPPPLPKFLRAAANDGIAGEKHLRKLADEIANDIGDMVRDNPPQRTTQEEDDMQQARVTSIPNQPNGMDIQFNGQRLIVNAVVDTEEDAKRLTDALIALTPFLPKPERKEPVQPQAGVPVMPARKVAMPSRNGDQAGIAE